MMWQFQQDIYCGKKNIQKELAKKDAIILKDKQKAKKEEQKAKKDAEKAKKDEKKSQER